MDSLEIQSSENIIERLLAKLQENKDARKANKEMIDDFLETSQEYRECVEVFDAAKNKKKVAKNKKMMEPQGLQLDEKRKELATDHAELKASLSVHLQALIASGKQEINVAGHELKIKVQCNVNAGQLRLF